MAASPPSATPRTPALLFVYNADGGLASRLLDAAHKVVSPGTYACNLCSLTYGTVAMKRPWRAFVASLPLPAEFLHRDEFRRLYGMQDVPLPAVFRRDEGGSVRPWIAAAEINAAPSLESLQDLVRRRLTESA